MENPAGELAEFKDKGEQLHERKTGHMRLRYVQDKKGHSNPCISAATDGLALLQARDLNVYICLKAKNVGASLRGIVSR